MAKRKKQKTEKKGFQYGNEIIGLLLILLSLTGLGSFGIVGELIKKFAIFMFGSWYFLFLGVTLFLGAYMIAKREKVNFFSARLIGVYTIILVILLFSHVSYIKGNELKGKEILTTTMANIENAWDVGSDIAIDNTGGGMTGGVFSWGLTSLFDIEGSYVIVGALLVFGFIMIFDITLVDIGRAIATAFRKIFSSDDELEEEESHKTKASKLDLQDIEEEEEAQKKLIITSVEDLPSHKEVVEVKKEPVEVDDKVERKYGNVA